MELQPISSDEVLKKLPKQKLKQAPRDQNPTELRVTKITQQARRADRYSVYINDKYSFSLNEYQLANSGLRNGKILTQDELDNFANESQFGKAYERTFNYVMIRPRSEKEITQYLTRTFLYPKPKSYVDKNGQRHTKPQIVDKSQVQIMISRVVDRLRDKGYIDDESFARAWVASRQLNKRSSLRKLRQELMVKGISSGIITNVLDDVAVNERNNLEELITKKRRLTKYKDVIKLTQYLLAQGYNYDDVKDALKDEE